jgi:hypothetical protein
VDEKYVITKNNIDFYPFKFPINYFYAGYYAGKAYYINIVTNANVFDFEFNPLEKFINFRTFDEDAQYLFFGILFSKNLLWCNSNENWLLSIDDIEHPYMVFENDSYTYICFKVGGGTHSIIVVGEHSIKEMMIGDVNNDGKVDLADLYLVWYAFGSYPGHPRWNVWADLDLNKKVDLKDIYMIIKEITLKDS